MNIDELREHIITVHEQPSVAVDLAPDADIVRWHEREHRPHWGVTDHAHDEFTAHRLKIPQYEPVA